YLYNGDGLLTERTEDGETTRYYYDGQVIIAEATIVNDKPKLKARYIRGKKLEAIQYEDNTKAYVLYNGHGDVVELRDEQGNVLNEYSYDIWGNPIVEKETVHNPFRYSGELWDSTTELQYLRARWYDPSVGRFINEDSYEGELNSPLTQNLYTYVLNNPLKYIDPSGNYCVSADGNWAHDGGCSSDSSYYAGEDSEFEGAPIIEDGIVTGYLNVKIPYAKKEGNFWDMYGGEVAKNTLVGTTDAFAGKYITDLLKPKNILAVTPEFGHAASVSGVKYPSNTQKLLGNTFKVGGVASIGLTGLQVYDDFQTYSGADQWIAAGITVVGTGVTIAGTVLIGSAGLPVAAVVGGGALIGTGVSIAVSWIKNSIFN
uniref:RHS repeat-associated core domain-containing protein n=1 Tax=Longirhabdus pacifica TaxID=2305227 RepID=UPI0013E8B6E8